MKTFTSFGVLAALLLTAPAAFATHCHEFDHFKVGLFYSAKAGTSVKPVSVIAQLTLSRQSAFGSSVEVTTEATDANVVQLKAVGDHFYAEKEIVSKVGECTDTVAPQVKFVVFNNDGSLDASAAAVSIKTVEGTGSVLETETNAVLTKERYAD